jgi:hypothetical protein
MQSAQSRSLWPLAEYVVFAAPCWLMPFMCAMDLMWLIANKSEWSEIPRSIGLMVTSLVGLIALTRVLFRRLVGKYEIGLPTAAMLIVGLGSCVYPAISWTSKDGEQWISLLFALPLPIFTHWLVSGLMHRMRERDY